MKKTLFTLICAFCVMICNAQDVTTYSVYDTNQSGDVTISDVTEVVENVKKNVSVAQSKQYVTADDLSTLFTTILNKLTSVEQRLSAIEAKVGIETPAEPDEPAENSNNGHEYVDLGLSVKWATMNVGATEVAGTKTDAHTGQLDCYGEYYAWSETTPKDTYNWSSYTLCNGSSSTITKYCTSSSNGTVDNKTILELTDDAARANWGGTWRMPTITEIEELLYNCYFEWTTSYNNSDVKGYIVYKVKDASDKGKKNSTASNAVTPTASYSISDTHIFLPASGSRRDSSFYDACSYWSSSLSEDVSKCASSLIFTSVDIDWNDTSRFRGQSVRAVCP